MKIYRSALLRFAPDGSPLYDSDGLLATAPDAQGQERVVAAGSWQALQAQYTQQAGARCSICPAG
jgi:guanine deaminase